MVCIIYIRHGESVQNQLLNKIAAGDVNLNYDDLRTKLDEHDPELTLKGQLQAAATANYLLDKLVGDVVVWRSSLLRAKQTSLPFIQKFEIKNKHIRTIDSLNEYDRHQESNDVEFYERVKKFNNNILKPFISEEINKYGTLVIFGHSIFFSTLINYQINQEKFCSIEGVSIHIPNCSITVMSFEMESDRYKWQHILGQYIQHLGPSIATGYRTSIGLD